MNGQTPGQAALSPAFARWYRIGLPLAADDVLAAAWAYQHETERAFWAEVDAAQEQPTPGQTLAQTPGQAAYEALRHVTEVIEEAALGGTDADVAVAAGAALGIARHALAAQEQPAPEPWAGSGFAALGTTADLDGDAPDEVRELAALRSGILGLAADLDRSAAETRPSRKSEIESETAIALRRLLETP